MKKFLLRFSILFLFQTGYGQHRIGDFMAYGSNSGLPASFYYTVLQSSDGYLWIGSSSGLVRFDGKNYKILFSNYEDSTTISDNTITDVIEDDMNNLWIAGLNQGLTKLNLHTGHSKRYSRLSKDKTTRYGINSLLKDQDGRMWVGTVGRGLALYLPEQDSFDFFIPDPLHPADGSDRWANQITGIAQDGSDPDILWLSCYDGLYSFNKREKTFQQFAFPHPYDKGLPLSFLCLETDHGDKIWLGTWYYGLMSFDKISHQFDTHRYAGSDPPNGLHYLVLDIKSIDDTTLYMASGNSGLLSFNKKTKEILPLLTNEQLPDGSSGIDIQRISTTPDAGLFVGGNYYIYQQHTAFNRFGNSAMFPYGNHFSVHAIVYDTSRMGYWVACLNAGEMIFFQSDMASRTLYKAENKSDIQFLDVAIDQKQNVWVVTPSSGLLILKQGDNVFRAIQHELPGFPALGPRIVCIESDPSGNLWMLSRENLYYFNVGQGTIQRYTLMPDSDEPLYNLTLCSGLHHDAWVASSNGLFYCIPDQNLLKHFVPDPHNQNGIANINIKSMTVDKLGNAWIGFESDGIQVISKKDHTVMASYNLGDGLPAMQINYMATDAVGGVWAGTAAGLAFLNPAPGEDVWHLFNREDGIKRDYIDRPIMTTENGRLFFNIEAGVSWIDIGEENASIENKPILHLISLDINGKPYSEDVLPDYLTLVELTYTTKEIRIEYAAMDWLHPTRTKYFYRIEGISPTEEWIENDQAMLILTGMKPGKYLLRLYAVNGDGIKSKEIELPILIHPPFWQRWWFITLCTLSILLLGYAIYRYRIEQLKKLQAMRNTISTNLHDDIGASLSNIHILTVLTQRNITNTDKASSYITKAGDEIQRISESLSDIVWNINPKYDDLSQLFIRMKRYAADMLEGKNIKSELIFPDEADKLSMPMDQRRDFYLIFKEAINNLVKYAQATEAKVVVMTGQKVIRLEITDNGKGFDESTLLSGIGIQNMKQRADKWKANIQVISGPGKGTGIFLEMKVG